MSKTNRHGLWLMVVLAVAGCAGEVTPGAGGSQELYEGAGDSYVAESYGATDLSGATDSSGATESAGYVGEPIDVVAGATDFTEHQEGVQIDVSGILKPAALDRLLFTSSSAEGLAIPELGTVESVIDLSGRSPSIFNDEHFTRIRVDVDITHSFRGDLRLILDNGTEAKLLLSESGDPTCDLVRSFEIVGYFSSDLTARPWKLTVMDLVPADAGTLNSWSISFYAP